MILDAQTLICDFHREQDWLRFLHKGTNDIPKSEQSAIHALLKRVARSQTEDELMSNKEQLFNSKLWNGETKEKLRTYLTNTWLTDDTIKVIYIINEMTN